MNFQKLTYVISSFYFSSFYQLAKNANTLTDYLEFGKGKGNAEVYLGTKLGWNTINVHTIIQKK